MALYKLLFKTKRKKEYFCVHKIYSDDSEIADFIFVTGSYLFGNNADRRIYFIINDAIGHLIDSDHANVGCWNFYV